MEENRFVGLTDAEAEESRQKNGSNRLTEIKGESFWKKLWGNFGDPMIKILLVALLINVALTIYNAVANPGEPVEWYEPVGIAAAVLIATLVSTFSEYKNESAFQKLQEEASRIKSKVYRNGELKEISIDELVVEDLVVLQSGDKIPADGILVDGHIKVDQSVLNGEAAEAPKSPAPEDFQDTDEALDFLHPNKVFRGSVVCSGNAVMKVTTVGDKSVYGKIASELQEEDDRESPLKVKLGKLANGISKFGYIGGVVIAVAFLFAKFFFHNGVFGIGDDYFVKDNWSTIVRDAVDAVMLAVIIIVMAVPEGLPLMIAIVSAQNMGKMLKDNVLVRKVEGIETAGSLNILFSDKTGTITKGNLEAVAFVDGAGNECKGYDTLPPTLAKLLALSLKKNTNAIVSHEGNEVKILGGNATERAVLAYVGSEKDAFEHIGVLNSVPFNSTDKYSATTVNQNGEVMTLIKGAPEKIIDKCSSYYDADGNVVAVKGFETLNRQLDVLAERAIRVLAVAISNEAIGEDGKLPGKDWMLVGVIGIRDEIRPESITAIAEVQNAGIQVVMITGDRKETAVAIAKESGLLKAEDGVVLTSAELQALSDEEIKEILPRLRVIARALPSDKSRLVKLAQELNLVAGMTGDGVNDSPALKKADVGFAMGGGTDVAKEASDIVILNDNFSSIDKAILYGRTIFNSIRKFIIFQLTINVAAVLISLIIPLMGLENVTNPLTITQILWVNLIMDTLAALAFGGEPPLKTYMQQPPKKRDENIVSKEMWSSIFTGGLYTVAVSLIFLLVPAFREIFGWSTDYFVHGDRFLTGYFTLFVFISVFNAFNARTEKFNLIDNIGKNKGFLAIIGLITVVQIIMVYVGGQIFECYGLNWKQWLIILGFAILVIPVDLARKAIVKIIKKTK